MSGTKKWNKKSWAKMIKGVEEYHKKVQSGEVEPPRVLKIIPATRCPSRGLSDLGGDGCQCCGVKGHKGLHWRYREDGCLEQWPNRKGLKPWEVAHSTTPPCHNSYINPKDKAAEYHMAHNKSKLVKPRRKKK